MRINALIANVDTKSGTKNGKAWKITTLMLIEKAKGRPRCKTPLMLQLADEDSDLLEQDIEDTALQFDITEVKPGFRDGEIEVRGTVVRQESASQPQSQPQPQLQAAAHTEPED